MLDISHHHKYVFLPGHLSLTIISKNYLNFLKIVWVRKTLVQLIMVRKALFLSWNLEHQRKWFFSLPQFVVVVIPEKPIRCWDDHNWVGPPGSSVGGCLAVGGPGLAGGLEGSKPPWHPSLPKTLAGPGPRHRSMPPFRLVHSLPCM